MATETETIEAINVKELFDSLDLNESIECSYEECEIESVFFLVCGECPERETTCAIHAAMIAVMQVETPDVIITFNNTCRHTPIVADCKLKAM